MDGEPSEADGAILKALSELTTGATLLKAGRSVREPKWLLNHGMKQLAQAHILPRPRHEGWPVGKGSGDLKDHVDLLL